jgi:3'(2'), 5'-bisphosphate nucleotidase
MLVDLEKIIDISIDAGNAILEVYNSVDFEIEKKTDGSPLTKADRASHDVIKERLLNLYPEIPVISEEGEEVPYEVRNKWKLFWLVDPLDGTKEFIRRNGEFTVNIALIKENEPILGIIYAPAYNENKNSLENGSGLLYYGDKNSGSYKRKGSTTLKLPLYKVGRNIKAVVSRSHSGKEEEKLLTRYNVSEVIPIGSSLKFCWVAEGRAQIYYRNGPTNEWDVAAGYAIAKYAGSKIDDLYFNKPKLTNGSFLVSNKLNNQ